MADGSEQIEAPPAAQRLPLVVFDEHRPPSAQRVSECVHCGFCLPACPTYLLWGREADSPRGRIYLMKMGLEGQAQLDDKFVSHFDTCLGCLACLTACPSGVKYDQLIEATRAQIERRHVRSRWERLFRRMMFAVLPYPRRLAVAALPLWAYQRSGLQWLLRRSGILKFLPVRAQMIEAIAPPVRHAWPRRGDDTEILPAIGERRLRVGMLLGCVQRVFFDEVNRSTISVLRAEGCEVVTPSAQACCGALMLHAGLEEQAMDFARTMIDAFQTSNVDVIAINSAGCGSAMKEYGHLLRDDPNYAQRAKAFSAKCRDVSEILAGLPPRARRSPMPMRVAFHDACHLQHAQKITAQPRELLKTIVGLHVLEIGEAGTCCGSAGIYNLVQPRAARDLGERKARHVLETGAQVLASANPGCLLQIRASLLSMGHDIPAVHWIQLLDASIHGTIPL